MSSCPSFLYYKWICLPLNLQLVSSDGNIADSYWTQPEFSISVSRSVLTVQLTHMLHFKHWEVSCPLLASIMVDQWEPAWYIREWHSAKENKEGQGAIKTHSRSSPTNLCTLYVSPRWHCSGRSSFFLSGMEARLCICTINHLGSCDVGIKAFFPNYITQNSLLSNKWFPSVMILRKESMKKLNVFRKMA